MSLRQASLGGTLPGRSLKTARVPWFANPGGIITSRYVDYSTSNASATAHTKGAWSQVVASLTEDVGLLMFNALGTQYTGDNAYLVDVGIGASGSETVIVQNVAVGGTGFSTTPMLSIPVFIPSGSRVAVRGQAAVGSSAAYYAWFFMRTNAHHFTPRSVDTIGTSTATSRGTAMSGASGSYVEITASTSQPYQALIVFPSSGNKTGVNANVRYTLAIGAAGSEIDIGAVDFNQASGGTIGLVANPSPQPPIIGRAIPAGTRLSIKHNVAANPDRVQATVIGVPYR